MNLKNLLIVMAGVALISGCASKGFVEEQIRESESRTSAGMGSLEGKTDTYGEEIEKLKALSQELSEKTDLAINKAQGFENYQIIWEGEINFDFDRYEITSVAEQTLMEAGQRMEQAPSSLVEIVGHADRTGSNKYNLLLGDKRANSARRYLADRFGVSLYRMFTLSYGEGKPVALPDEAQASSKNRRVKLFVWGEM